MNIQIQKSSEQAKNAIKSLENSDQQNTYEIKKLNDKVKELEKKLKN